MSMWVCEKKLFFRKSYDDTLRNKKILNKHHLAVKKIKFELCTFWVKKQFSSFLPAKKVTFEPEPWFFLLLVILIDHQKIHIPV